MSGTQQEQLRQQYLAAMGVTLWLPRQVLPGAAPSPTWRWCALEQGGLVDANSPLISSSASTSISGSVLVPGKTPLRQLLQVPAAAALSAPIPEEPSSPLSTAHSRSVNRASEAESAPESHPADRVNAESPVAASTVPRFRLAMIGYSDCLVVTELPLSHASPWSESQQQLLDAILAAVGLGGDSLASGAVREFQWPLDPLASFDQSMPIARHALKVALAGELRAEHRVLLLMGGSAQEYLLTPASSHLQGQLIDHQGRLALCCHGLNEVLRLPRFKAELWRQLQPLRTLPYERG